MYQHSVAPVTLHSRLLAACVAYNGLVSHRSAAALHGIDGHELRRPEVVVDPDQGRSAVGIIVHRSAQMGLAQPVKRDGIPCTGLGRTLPVVVVERDAQVSGDGVARGRLSDDGVAANVTPCST